MLKNVGENIKKFALIFFYSRDIKNIIFNPKFYQHFLPSLVIADIRISEYPIILVQTVGGDVRSCRVE